MRRVRMLWKIKKGAITMKQINQYICLVDYYRRPSRQRNTTGRYRVGAKTTNEAKKLVQKAIGFGSVQVYYKEDLSDLTAKTNMLCQSVPYKTVMQEIFVPKIGYQQIPVRKATDAIK